MPDKTENLLVWGEAVAILIVLALFFIPHSAFPDIPLFHLLAEKWFDILLALIGTLLGYLLAKRHIENLMAEIDKRYQNTFRERAFHRAVSAMLPELPSFHIRADSTFSRQVVDAVGEFTQWSAALDPTHTPEKSMEMVGKEAYILAAKMIEEDMGYKQTDSTGNYEWVVGVAGLPAGWQVQEVPDISIYNWDTGIAAQKYMVMKESARTADSICFRWMWNTNNVPCGVYVGVVNYKIGGEPVIGKSVGERVRIFLKRENGQIIKTPESIPWD